MAKMLPKCNPDEISNVPERQVFVALQEQLPDDYIVLHSYPWLRRSSKGRSRELQEGEADFVVLHPKRGLLVLEVKGGDLEYRDHQWHRIKDSGLEKVTNPFQQGRDSMHTLLKGVEARTGGRLRKEDLVYGYAVCFPQQDYSGGMPHDAESAIIISRLHMSKLEAEIRRAFASWTRKPKEMREYQFELLQDGLLPRFRVYRPLGTQIEEDDSVLFDLTEDQAALFRGLYDNSRVLVDGPAGSGKTFLALDRALLSARQGVKTLFVCFNRDLAFWLEDLINAEPRYYDCRENLDVWNFHRLARAMADRARVEYSVPSGAHAQQFWEEEMPDILEQAAEVLASQGSPWRYGAIVVDEGQDFSLLWWDVLTYSLLEDSERGPLYIFRDRAQSLRASAAEPPDGLGLVPYKLTRNCRNTQRIARVSANLIAQQIDVIKRAPRGAEPRILLVDDLKAQRERTIKTLKDLLQKDRFEPHQIALIGPAAKNKGCLANESKVAGVNLVTSAREWRKRDGVLVTTSRAFKGLEADAVIVYDLGELGAWFNKIDLYVAFTRAKHLLTVITHDEQSRDLIEAALKESS